MDAAMFAKFHQEEKPKPQPLTKIPKDLREGFEAFFEPIWKIEKESYDDNSLMTFEQFEQKVRAEAEAGFIEEYETILKAETLLKEQFLKEEETNPDIDKEAKFAALKNFLLKQKDEATGEIVLHSPFMDRAYQYASKLVFSQNIEDAEAIYRFLLTLNSQVFEYWFGEALCLQLLGDYESAIDNYTISLFLRPHMPLVFFHMANCYLALNKKENAITALEVCLEETKEEESDENRALEDEALLLLQKLQ